MNQKNMTIFDKAKLVKCDSTRECFSCGVAFKPDLRNVKRGWGMNCSKSCASKMKIKMSNLSELDKKAIMRDWRLNQLGI